MNKNKYLLNVNSSPPISAMMLALLYTSSSSTSLSVNKKNKRNSYTSTGISRKYPIWKTISIKKTHQKPSFKRYFSGSITFIVVSAVLPLHNAETTTTGIYFYF